MTTLTAAEKAALETWADSAEKRAEIEDFIEWIHEQGVFLHFGKTGHSLTQLLDAFYGINRTNLESARRALLTQNERLCQEMVEREQQ